MIEMEFLLYNVEYKTFRTVQITCSSVKECFEKLDKVMKPNEVLESWNIISNEKTAINELLESLNLKE